MPTKKTIVLLLLVVISAIALRSVNLGEKSLWSDEGATWLFSTDELAVILDGDQDNHHPPGYYAIVHMVIVTLGDSEAMLRIPSVVGSAVAIVFAFFAVRRLWGNRAAWSTAALLLLSPMDLWYAQEARQPAIAAMFIAGFMYVFARRDWVGNVLGVLLLIAGLYFDYIVAAGWAGLMGIYLYPWKRRTRRDLIEILAITTVALAVFLPLEGEAFWTGFSSLQLQAGPGIWYGRILGSNPITSNPATSLLAILVGGWLAAGIVHKATASRRFGSIAVRLGLLMYIVFIMAPAIDRAYSLKRIIVVISPLLAAICVYLLTRLKASSLKRWAVALVAVAVVSLVLTIRLPKDDWRGAVEYINASAAVGDVAWTDNVSWLPGLYDYYSGVPPFFIDGNPSDQVSSSAESTDVWLITRRRPQDSIPAIPAEGWFDDNLDLVHEEPFHRLAVRRYSKP